MAATLQRPSTDAFCPSAEFDAKYELGHLLGKGGFGSVYSCTERTTGRKVACKVLNKKHVLDSLGVEPRKEVGIMQELADQHYGVVQLTDSVEDSANHYVVMEFCSGGSLLDILKKNGAMPESSARLVLGQVAAALAFCHSKRVLHLDIKPENIFFLDPASESLYGSSFASPFSLASLQSSLDVRARLADFGMATVLKQGRKVRGDVGSPHFKAPEIVSGHKFGLEVDVWSLGVVLCVMLTGTVPFLGTSNHDTRGLNEAIRRGRINFDSAKWWKVSDAAKDLVKRMLEVDPAKRITAAEVLEHPWFSTVQAEPPVEQEILPAFALDIAAAQRNKTAALRPVQASKVTAMAAGPAPSKMPRYFTVKSYLQSAHSASASKPLNVGARAAALSYGVL